jgi:hypothetical protein
MTGILRIHPSFRIVALANPPQAGKGDWLQAELIPLFAFHNVCSWAIPARLFKIHILS